MGRGIVRATGARTADVTGGRPFATAEPPPPSALAAFGLHGRPVALAGGQGRAWRVDDAVLKPLELTDAELDWQVALLARLSGDGFRVARPIVSRDGRNSVDGWHAQQLLRGRHEPRWHEIIEVGQRFHAALSAEPRPAFLDSRQDPWAIGDRVAWEELPVHGFSSVAHLERLASARRPVAGRDQLVHGDLGGNVLFDDPDPPGVIDFSPYWRPPAFSSAIVVADALVWEGADESILSTLASIPGYEQYLVRALIYRAVAAHLLHRMGRIPSDEREWFAPVVDLVERLASR